MPPKLDLDKIERGVQRGGKIYRDVQKFAKNPNTQKAVKVGKNIYKGVKQAGGVKKYVRANKGAIKDFAKRTGQAALDDLASRF